MKKTLLILLTLLSKAALYSQINSENRIEFESRDGYTDEYIYQFGKTGFLMSALNQNSPKGKKEWRYELFDTSLQSKTITELEIPKQFSASQYFKKNENIYNLYKDKKGNFIIVNLNVATMQIEQVEGKFPKKFYLKDDMVVLGNYAYFSGRIGKKPNVVIVDLKEGTTTVVPIMIKGIKPKKISLLNFQLLEKEKEVFIYVEGMITKKVSNTFAIKLNENGETEELIKINDHDNRIINSASASKIADNKYVFIGTYASNSVNNSTEGYYISESENGQPNYIKYYNFLDLKNFLSFLPEKKAEKIKKKKKRKEKRGKTYSLNYEVAGHDLIVQDDAYLFLGEFYYPTYRTETYTTTTTNASGAVVTTTQTRQVFDGYQYTHAAIIKFTKDGEFVWDNTFKMSSFYKPYYVKKFITISNQSASEIGLAFADYNRVNTLSIDLNSGEINKDRKSDRIETGFHGDKERYSYSEMDYWYDNYFITFGTQTIKNKEDKNVKKKRSVFFVSKYKYE